MKISAIDNSLKSPGITIFELDGNHEIINIDYFSVMCDKPKKKDPPKAHRDSDNIITLKGYKDFYDRIYRKNNFITHYLLDCSYTAIEGYSYGSCGGSLYQIGENTGLLKSMLYQSNIAIRIYEPSSIKMFFTGKGNATKYDMFDTYMSLNNPLGLSNKLVGMGIEANEHFKKIGKKKNFNPTEDIIDSYAICYLLYTELLLRKGLIDLKTLSDKQIQVFNKIHKNTKTNILDEDFIKKRD